MHILVVDGFDDSSKGRSEFKIFKDLISTSFKAVEVPDCNFFDRKINRIGDLVVDWEHDHLNDTSRNNCKNFDKFDFIFIGGDMHICPWEPVATQVVTLIHMCKFMKKPLFCSGFGAFSAIYTMATKGARFHILNGPIGEEIEHLPAFPRYSIGTGAYPSGWMDNETGDLYTYNRHNHCWEPICNLGIYRIAANGTPSSNRHAPLTKRYAREDHLLDFRQIVEPLDVDATVTRIRSVNLQHYSVRDLEAQNCVLKCYPHWYIKSDGSLPSGENLNVIADSVKGAILLSKDNIFIMACKVDKSVSYSNYQKIVTNFVGFIMKQVRDLNRDKIEGSMLEFLFGKHGMGTGTYDSFHAKLPMSPPLSRTAVPTALPEGPVKVDPPAIGMFLYTPKQDSVDYLALTANRRNSTVGRAPKIQVQNPLSARQKRLQLLTAKVITGVSTTALERNGSTGGGAAVVPLLPGSVSALTQEEASAGVPEQVKELFTGILMNTHSVSRRRAPHVLQAEPEAPPTLERLLAEARSAPLTEYDREVEGYDLGAHIQPFGETWVIPGTNPAAGKPASPRVQHCRSFNLEKLGLEEGEVSDIMFNPVGRAPSLEDSCDETPSSIQPDAAVVKTKVPFASSSPRRAGASVRDASSSPSSQAPPKQPATPRSSASAARLASRINREYRQYAADHGISLTPALPPDVAAAQALAAKEAYEGNSSEDSASEEERDPQQQCTSSPPYPSMSALSGESIGANMSNWSSCFSGGRVPNIPNWSRVQQQQHQQTHGDSTSQRSPWRHKYGSSVSNSQVSARELNATSSLLVPTLSSAMRSSLTSQIAHIDAPETHAFPLPQSARTAKEIAATQRSLYLPVRHPPGSVHRTAAADSELGDDGDSSSEVAGTSTNLSETLHRLQGSAKTPYGESGSMYLLQSARRSCSPYRDTATREVLLPSRVGAERPYSSYQKITRALASREHSQRQGVYQGAYTHEFRNPDEAERKEYMHSREKFLAGAFKTSFGYANSSLQLRSEGHLRGEGPYPLEPAGSATARPENTTAIHFASMPRSTQPLLAGAWKT